MTLKIQLFWSNCVYLCCWKNIKRHITVFLKNKKNHPNSKIFFEISENRKTPKFSLFHYFQKRPKETLICRSCIETNHSTHIFVSFSNVAAQYEANKKILLAESLLKKKLKAVDEALLAFDKTKAEAIDHRRVSFDINSPNEIIYFFREWQMHWWILERKQITRISTKAWIDLWVLWNHLESCSRRWAAIWINLKIPQRYPYQIILLSGILQ